MGCRLWNTSLISRILFQLGEMMKTSPPCITSVPYRGVCNTMGVFITMGGIMMHVWGYLEYRGGCSVLWGYHYKCRVYLGYLGVFSTVGDIMSTLGLILSAMGILSTVGDIISTMGCSVPWGKIFCYLSTPMVLNTPRYSRYTPHL